MTPTTEQLKELVARLRKYELTAGEWTSEEAADALEAVIAEREKVAPVAVVDADDDVYWADILPDRSVKVGQKLYAAPPDLESLRADADRIDFLERESHGRSGCSMQYSKYVEDGQVIERGYRFMRFHDIGQPKKTLREAIDEARKGGV